MLITFSILNNYGDQVQRCDYYLCGMNLKLTSVISIFMLSCPGDTDWDVL